MVENTKNENKDLKKENENLKNELTKEGAEKFEVSNAGHLLDFDFGIRHVTIGRTIQGFNIEIKTNLDNENVKEINSIKQFLSKEDQDFLFKPLKFHHEGNIKENLPEFIKKLKELNN